MTAPDGAGRIDPGSVLVVEDSPEDTEAIERALRQTHPDLRTEFVARGAGLVESLLARDALPGLILLDLNMPGVSGHALLAAIRARPELREVTVVVFTSSTSPHEVESCYAAGADSYIYKPVNFHLFRTVLKGAVDYWRQSGPRGADGADRGPVT
ncbi:response regulator [Streptomyces sp. NPDC023723]|uniref:response regulator n=1 Tax=Streptomyces sp. NPDC023723 TaxID=3154323 RepID=UPI0033FA2ED8